MRITGINLNTQGFRGAYIVKGNSKEISKFSRKLDDNLTHFDRWNGDKVMDYTPKYIGLRLSPKQPRFDLLVVTQDDMQKLRQYESEKQKQPLQGHGGRLEELLENPYTKEFSQYYMQDLKKNTKEIETALGKRIKTIDAQQALTAIERGRFSFVSGRIKK